MVTSAATDLAGIGSTISAANAAAASQTATVAAAGADEISAAIAAAFGTYAQGYQTVSAQVAAFHDQFARALATGGNAYVLAEAANASPLRRCWTSSTRRLRRCWDVR
jgi:PE family